MFKTSPFIKKFLSFGVIFTIAKGIVYLTPLLLADYLSETDFGILEYALAGLGMIINSIINLGVPGSYPYFILKRKSRYVKEGFSLHGIVLIIPFLVNQLLYVYFNMQLSFYLAFNVSYILANQLFYSTQLKSHQRPIPAVLLDSGVYIILMGLIVYSYLFNIKLDINLINSVLLIYGLVYVLKAIYIFYYAKKDLILKKYVKILKFGVHILLSTFLIFLITTSGRVIVELFFDYEQVGIYAFYFRLSAAVVMIYQIISITFFKEIYTLNPKTLDKYFYQFFIFIFILSLLFFFIAPHLLGVFSQYFKETYSSNKLAYFLLSSQMVMWIATALNSNIINRENLAPTNNKVLLILVCIITLILFVIKSYITFNLLIVIHYTAIFLAAIVQYYNLFKKGIKFNNSAVVLAIIYLITLIVYLFA